MCLPPTTVWVYVVCLFVCLLCRIRRKSAGQTAITNELNEFGIILCRFAFN